METILPYLIAICISILCGLYGMYYSTQGIRKVYEFKIDRKIFVFLCIISGIVDTLSVMMYFKYITLPSQLSYFPFNFYRLVQHIFLCMLYSYWLSPMEKKYAYYNAIVAIPLWSFPKIVGLENFHAMDLMSGPISHFLLFCASVHFLGNLNNRTIPPIKPDPLYQIGSVNIIYFGMMTITYLLMNYNPIYVKYISFLNIIQDVYYIYALYFFTQKTNFEIHDWL